VREREREREREKDRETIDARLVKTLLVKFRGEIILNRLAQELTQILNSERPSTFAREFDVKLNF
jgi:hypothetical protein